MKGILITLEGNDGSGKSSVIEAIRKTLEEKGYPVVYTREPGGSQIAENIRKVILDVENTGMDARTEALLYAASRREHIEKTIRPALEAGQIVLCDRFIDSSLAYQGYARGLGIDEVYNMNLYATEGLLPDLTILVCVKPEIGIARITQNHRGELDRLESEKMEFHQKVYQGYLAVQKKFPNRIQMIDGEKTKEEVRLDALDIVLRFIGED
ncbi:MAG: dTMP kinase [Prevotella sp.]|nr:dTMP kinase [Staphylococcus sp.]MCM1350729.1 dTMP kinase [Prevotella sp.]